MEQKSKSQQVLYVKVYNHPFKIGEEHAGDHTNSHKKFT